VYSYYVEPIASQHLATLRAPVTAKFYVTKDTWHNAPPVTLHLIDGEARTIKAALERHDIGA